MGSGMRSYTVTLDDPLDVLHQVVRLVNTFHLENRITNMEYVYDTPELRMANAARLKISWENVTPPEHIIDGWDD